MDRLSAPRGACYSSGMRIVPLVALIGCARFEDVHTVTLPAEGVFNLFADNDRGDISYAGTAADATFTVQVRSWASGRSSGRAERRASNNTFGAVVSGDLLDLWGRSGVSRAGVDLDVVGPPVMNVEAITLSGAVVLSDVDGYHYVTATEVVGERVYGDIDAYADGGGASIEIYPYLDSIVRIEAFASDAVVALPYGLPYDLRVYADPDWGYDVEDLGFDSLVLGGDYALGTTGAGSILVEVIATSGTVVVTSAP